MTELAGPAFLDSPTVTVGIVRWSVGVAAALAASMVLSSCIGDSPGAAQRDQRFLVELHQAIPNITQARSNTELVRLGNAVCDAFDAGVSSLQIADRLGTDNATLPSEDLGAVMRSAVDALCPRYRSDL